MQERSLVKVLQGLLLRQQIGMEGIVANMFIKELNGRKFIEF